MSELLPRLGEAAAQVYNYSLPFRPLFTRSDFANLTSVQALEHALAELRYVEELLCESNVLSEDRIQEIFVKLYSKTEVDKKQ